MKQSDIKELLNNNKKIELVSFSKKTGFTKEETEKIINTLIYYYNNKIDIDEIKIKINHFEMIVYNEKEAILKTLKKFRVQIKESEKNMKEQINAVTKHVYTGNNAIELEKAGFNSNEWVGSGQVRKLKKQVKKNAKGVVIKVYKENEDGQTFCKLETIYNIEELEEIKKVENTSQFKDMVNRFKNMFVRKRA
jgi:DNA-binding protein H-NS